MRCLIVQDGKRLAESPRCKLIAEDDHYTLLIYEVRPEDAGKYDCTLSNKHGQTACSARLNVVGMRTALTIFIYTIIKSTVTAAVLVSAGSGRCTGWRCTASRAELETVNK